MGGFFYAGTAVLEPVLTAGDSGTLHQTRPFAVTHNASLCQLSARTERSRHWGRPQAQQNIFGFQNEAPFSKASKGVGGGIFEAKTHESVTDGTAGAIKLSVS